MKEDNWVGSFKGWILMEYRIRLPIKSHASSFYDIIKIVEGYTIKKDAKFQYITFNEPKVELEQLIHLARSLSAFKFFIDGKEIPKSNLYSIERVLFCEDKGTCEGVCTHEALHAIRGYKGFNIQKIVHLLSTKAIYQEELDDLEEIAIVGRKQGWQIKEETESKDIYNHYLDKLVDEVKKGLNFEFKYCQVINLEQIETQLRTIPDQLVFDKEDEIEEDLPEPILVELKEEQLTNLAQCIAQELTKAMREILVEAGILERKS